MPNPMAINDYLQAVYTLQCESGQYEFSFVRASVDGGEKNAVDAGSSWAIVSARNPMSLELPEEANRKRDRELDVVLREAELENDAAEGRSADGTWREPSRVLFGIDRCLALSIARRFEQRAIVWGTGPEVGILDCLSERWVVRPVYGRSPSEPRR